MTTTSTKKSPSEKILGELTEKDGNVYTWTQAGWVLLAENTTIEDYMYAAYGLTPAEIAAQRKLRSK